MEGYKLVKAKAKNKCDECELQDDEGWRQCILPCMYNQKGYVQKVFKKIKPSLKIKGETANE